jgi:hypothetical protein
MEQRWVRDNAFLVAAGALPLLVVGVFLLLTAIPKWTVPPPQYDLLVYTTDYGHQGARIAVEFAVVGETLQATVRPAAAETYPPRLRLWRFDHRTMSATEVHVDLPTEIPAGEPARTFAVEALRGRRVLGDSKARDGYEYRTPTDGGPGLIGDVFGMRRNDQRGVIVNRGRVVQIEIPAPSQYAPPVFLGWLADGEGR